MRFVPISVTSSKYAVPIRPVVREQPLRQQPQGVLDRPDALAVLPEQLPHQLLDVLEQPVPPGVDGREQVAPQLLLHAPPQVLGVVRPVGEDGQHLIDVVPPLEVPHQRHQVRAVVIVARGEPGRHGQLRLGVDEQVDLVAEEGALVHPPGGPGQGVLVGVAGGVVPCEDVGGIHHEEPALDDAHVDEVADHRPEDVLEDGLGEVAGVEPPAHGGVVHDLPGLDAAGLPHAVAGPEEELVAPVGGVGEGPEEDCAQLPLVELWGDGPDVVEHVAEGPHDLLDVHGGLLALVLGCGRADALVGLPVVELERGLPPLRVEVDPHVVDPGAPEAPLLDEGVEGAGALAAEEFGGLGLGESP